MKNTILDDSVEIESLKKELYKIEYVSDLTVKIKKRDFDGREFVVEKLTWVTQASPDKYESNSKCKKLIRHNKSNGWLKKNDLKYEKSNLILELSNFHVQSGTTEWNILIKTK